MMRVSQRLDYALRTLVLLADQPADVRSVAGDLAQHLSLPRRFVEQQVSILARAGIVSCRRGATGGCKLARPAAEITVREVVEALHGEVLDVPRQPGSATAELWQETAETLGDYLSEKTIAQVVARQHELDAESAAIYFI